MKNTYQSKFPNSKKTSIRTLPAKKPNANPSDAHSSRKGSTVKRPQSTRKGLMGFSAGQKVPMKFMEPDYTKPNPHGMPKIQEANSIKRSAKKALGGKQKKFFGL